MCVCVCVVVVPPAGGAATSVYIGPDAAFTVVCVIDATAPVVVVVTDVDVAAVTQLLVVGPLLTEHLSKLI